MNRREFMRRMFGLTVSIAVGPTIRISTIEEDLFFNKIPISTSDLLPKDVIWMVNSFNLYVHNPAKCAIITGITSRQESLLEGLMRRSRLSQK